MKSIQPRKQRKMFFNAPLHKKRAWIAAHLTENLLLKYDRRSISVIKGDTIKVMRGSFKGHEDKVAQVHVRKQVIEVEGITTVKADGTKIAKPMHASNVMITKLNLADKWRRKKLERGLSEETKKAIEKEAEEQVKELEEEKRIADELAEEEFEEGKKIPEEMEEIPEKKTVKKAPSEKAEKKEETAKEEKQGKKTEGKKKPKTEKTAIKKKVESSKKKTVKKAPTKKKMEGKK